MKKKSLAGILSVLICIALIGIGFASWVITVDQSAEATGNILVDTVEDSSHVVTLAEGSNLNVVFGAKAKGSEATKNWMTYKDSSKNEALEVSLKVTVTNYISLNQTTPFTFTLTDTSEGGAYSKAATAGYVATLESILNDPNAIKVSAPVADSTSATYTVTVKFAWGTHFEGKNPIDYYNQFDATATNSDSITYQEDAQNVLNSAEFTGLTSVALKLTIAPNTGASA